MQITLHITSRPMDEWALNYPVIPRVGDRVLHPSSEGVLLAVDSVLIHQKSGPDLGFTPDAEIYCSEVEA